MIDTREGSRMQSQIPLWVATWTTRQASVADSVGVPCVPATTPRAGAWLPLGLLAVLWAAVFVLAIVSERRRDR